MHNVERIEEPEILKRKGSEWKQQYIELIENDSPKKSSFLLGKYNHPDIKAALKEMYGSCCCYCEGDVEPTSVLQVEHYRPKSLFPEQAFEWKNLHYCCSKCNITKSDKWDEQNPILNPVDDIPEDHLSYKKYYIIYDENDMRAKNTVDHVDLNRDGLIERRSHILEKVFLLLKKYQNLVDDKDVLKAMINDAVDSESSFVSFRDYVKSIVVEELFQNL